MKRLLILTVLPFFVSAGLAQSETVYIPQVGHGLGFETTFSFVNLSSTTTRITIKTFTNDGTEANLLPLNPPFGDLVATSEIGIEIQGFGAREVTTVSDDDSALIVGYAEIESQSVITDPGSGEVTSSFGVEVVFRRFNGGALVTSASVLPGPPLTAFSFIGSNDNFSKSGLAFVNPEGSGDSAEITVDLLDGFGGVVDSVTFNLAEGEKISVFINEDPLFPGLDTFNGSAEVRSSLPIAVTVIRQEGAAAFFTTQTVQPSRAIP